MLFGTDGIRGIANAELTRNAYCLGVALCAVTPGCRVVIGRDTRLFGGVLLSALVAGLKKGGGTPVDGGILPTPAVAWAVEAENADYGVVLTASHNPPEYNGLKVFGKKGKLPSKLTDELETEIGKAEYSATRVLHKETPLAEAYIRSMTEGAKRLDGMTFVLDCAEGAASYVAPEIFRRLGAKVRAVSAEGRGEKINLSCGALYPERLAAEVMLTGSDAGFAFDGDADRLAAVTRTGKLLDGDGILNMLAGELKEKGELKNNEIAVTVMSGLALKKSLAKQGIAITVTGVGDHLVAERIRERGLSLGGEQSGHVILNGVTGDGILAALRVAEILKKSGQPLENWFLAPLPRRTFNVRAGDKRADGENVASAVEKARREVGDSGTVLVRPSGTEPVIRLMTESEDEGAADRAMEILKAAFDT